MDLNQAARAYHLAVLAAAEHRDALHMADAAAAQAREALAALDPAHPLLQLTPAEIAAAPSPFALHPLQMLVELFLQPHPYRTPSPVSPTSALLAGSLALVQTGPGTASPSEVLRRVSVLLRSPVLQRF